MHDQGQSHQPTPQSEPQQPAAQARSAADPAPSPAPAAEQAPSAPGQRGYGATVRGQIQRVRVDLLSRETQRLGRTLQEILEQQQEDRRWRDHWQSRFTELSGQVDQLVDETTRVAATAAAGQEVKETVRPLLCAVLEMLDHGAERSDAASDAMAELTPALRDLNAAAESLQQGDGMAQRPPAAQLAEAPVRARDETRPMPQPQPPSQPQAISATAVDHSAAAGAGSLERVGAEILALRDPAPAQATPEREVPATAAPVSSEETDELRIEIARLLKPQDEPEERETLTLDQVTAAPQPTPSAGEPADDAPLLLGTRETPEIEPPRAAVEAAPQQTPAGREVQGPAAGSQAPAAPPAGTAQASQGRAQQSQTSPSPAAGTAQAQAAPATRSVTAGGPSSRLAQDQRGVATPPRRRPGSDAVQAAPPAARKPVMAAEARRMAVASARSAQRQSPTDQPEGLPKCLTERWEGDPGGGADWSDDAQAAAARDKGAFRWPFRRLRATIEEDHAADRAEQAGTRDRDQARTQATRGGGQGR